MGTMNVTMKNIHQGPTECERNSQRALNPVHGVVDVSVQGDSQYLVSCDPEEKFWSDALAF